MKKILLFIYTLLGISSFSQNIYVTKRDYTSLNSSTYIHSLQEINQTNGNVINNYNYTTLFPSSYSPESLTYNAQTNEIFGISGNIITKYNKATGLETSFTLPTIQNVVYRNLIIANNRLFIIKTDYTSMNISTYIHSLQEINQTNGNVINNYNYTTFFPNGNSPKSLTFNVVTKEIIAISDNIIIKYNILTGLETSFSLPTIQNVNYRNLIIANNRLFIIKRDYTSMNTNTYIHSLQEINQTNGNVIYNYNYTTIFPNGNSPDSLTFDNLTKEIYGISGNTIVKYNIITGLETSFNLPTIQYIDYSDLISINSEDTLGVNENLIDIEESKPIKAFNLLGQEIPIETYNQIIILKFDNGKSKKIYNQK
jgi:hypothetical protein